MLFERLFSFKSHRITAASQFGCRAPTSACGTTPDCCGRSLSRWTRTSALCLIWCVCVLVSSVDSLFQAYVGNTDVGYAPYKRSRGRQLTERQQAYNIILAWYRVTIEHVIAFVKRFADLFRSCLLTGNRVCSDFSSLAANFAGSWSVRLTRFMTTCSLLAA